MEETGRVFYVIEGECEALTHQPYGFDYATWTEHRDEDGDLWYVSDHEGMTLDAEEFGPIEGDDA